MKLRRQGTDWAEPDPNLWLEGSAVGDGTITAADEGCAGVDDKPKSEQLPGCCLCNSIEWQSVATCSLLQFQHNVWVSMVDLCEICTDALDVRFCCLTEYVFLFCCQIWMKAVIKIHPLRHQRHVSDTTNSLYVAALIEYAGYRSLRNMRC